MLLYIYRIFNQSFSVWLPTVNWSNLIVRILLSINSILHQVFSKFTPKNILKVQILFPIYNTLHQSITLWIPTVEQKSQVSKHSSLFKMFCINLPLHECLQCVNDQWNCSLTQMFANLLALIKTASITATVNKATSQSKQPRWSELKPSTRPAYEYYRYL